MRIFDQEDQTVIEEPEEARAHDSVTQVHGQLKVTKIGENQKLPTFLTTEKRTARGEKVTNFYVQSHVVVVAGH